MFAVVAADVAGERRALGVHVSQDEQSHDLTISVRLADDAVVQSEVELSLGPPFGVVSGRVLSEALEFLFANDYGDRERLLTGMPVSRIVAATPQVATDPTGVDGSADAYRMGRPPLVALLRPRFLAAKVDPRQKAYQLQGTQWLIEHPRGILADDMGLGKTIQALTAMQELIRLGQITQALIIVPKSLVANWASEARRWTPDLTVMRVAPRSSDRQAVWRLVRGRAHILLTTYDHVRQARALVFEKPWDLIVCDEAHRLRNGGAALTKALRTANAARFWALTGTPIERSATDLATLLSVIDPRQFSARDAAADPVELRVRARGYLLRRRKGDVLTQLPEVDERIEWLDLRPAQRVAYSLALAEMGDSDAELLAVITRLRSICDVDLGTGQSSKLDRIEEILEEVRFAGRKAVIFSYTIAPLEFLRDRLARARISHELFTGELTPEERTRVLTNWRRPEGPTALLASSRVAGEGLTLTEANTVLFINEWWNPSANDQARDRVVRLGQEREVAVWRFACLGTIEEDVQRILDRKRVTVKEFVDDPTRRALVQRDLLQQLRDAARGT